VLRLLNAFIEWDLEVLLSIKLGQPRSPNEWSCYWCWC